MADPIVLPVLNQNYDCHSCGHCCRNYTVPVTEEDRRRIEAQGWANEPDFVGLDLFVKHSVLDDYVLNQKADGSCVFLDAEGRCRIHGKFGGQTKPLGCRMYPFVFNRVGRETYVSVRFDCPSVAANKGRALEAQRGELAKLGREVIAARRAAPLTFRHTDTLPDEHLVTAANALEWIIADNAVDLTRRVLACVSVAHLLQSCSLAKVEELAKMKEFLHLASDAALADVKAAPLERKPARGLVAMSFRQTLAMYARRDREEFSISHRWRQASSTLSGRGNVPAWQPGLPSVPWTMLEDPFVIGAAAAALLARNLRSKLAGLGFFGPAFHGFSFLEGLRSLLLAYPVTLWFARLYCVAEARREIDEECASRALHLVEGPWGRRPVFRLRAERRRTEVLTQPEHLRGLVAWYGT